MKALILVDHPDVAGLFALLTNLNGRLTRSLSAVVNKRQQLIWSAKAEYGSRYWEDRLDEMEVKVQVTCSEIKEVVCLSTDEIGGDVKLAPVVFSDYSFVVKRHNNDWVIEIIDRGSVTIQFDGAAVKFIAKELRKRRYH